MRATKVLLRRAIAGVCGLSTALIVAPSAIAADKFYDTAATAGLQSGAGTWNLSTDGTPASVWSTTSAGTALTTFDIGDDALFQTAGASTVTIGSAVSAASLNSTVNSTAPTFSGGGQLTLTSTGPEG